MPNANGINILECVDTTTEPTEKKRVETVQITSNKRDKRTWHKILFRYYSVVLQPKLTPHSGVYARVSVLILIQIMGKHLVFYDMTFGMSVQYTSGGKQARIYTFTAYIKQAIYIISISHLIF